MNRAAESLLPRLGGIHDVRNGKDDEDGEAGQVEARSDEASVPMGFRVAAGDGEAEPQGEAKQREPSNESSTDPGPHAALAIL